MQTAARRKLTIRYQDHLSWQWVWLNAPVRWRGNVDLIFRNISYAELERAGNRLNPVRVEQWISKLEQGAPIPPPIVCATERDSLYLRDGNHRHEALRRFLGNTSAHAEVRVAIAVPKAGFEFRRHKYGEYSTYVLVPQPLRQSCSGYLSDLMAEPHRGEFGLAQEVPLFARPLVLVAHADDETACAALLQRAQDPAVIFCTDGAPRPQFFWEKYGSRENYAAVRCEEAARALSILGVRKPHFLRDRVTERCFQDQELFRQITSALDVLLEYAARIQPDAVVAPAYEGGHPDHDSCSLLACLVGRTLNVPVWEMPLYHRSQSGVLVHQQFPATNGTEITLRSTSAELSKRNEMFSIYASQPDASDFVSSRVEVFRPQPSYDYSRPPHIGSLNYEVWGWPMTGSEVCTAFQSCLTEYAANRPSTPSNQSASLDIDKRRELLWSECWKRVPTLRKWARTVLGTTLCTATAVSLTLLGGGSLETFFPVLFLCIIVFVATTFGNIAGRLGTIIAALVFAEFLFDPTLSLKVHDPAQRNTLIWMIVGGMAMSELLGYKPSRASNKTS